MQGKRRAIGILLTFCLLFALLPGTAFAAELTLNSATVDGSNVEGAVIAAGSTPEFKIEFGKNVTDDSVFNANSACISLQTGGGIVEASVAKKPGDTEKGNLYITPDAPLAPGDNYKLVVAAGVTSKGAPPDTLGTQQVFNFTVRDAFGVASCTVSGAPLSGAELLAGDKPNLKVTFNEDVNTYFSDNKTKVSLTKGTTSLVTIETSQKLGNNDNKSMIFTPSAPLVRGTYTLTVSGGAVGVKSNGGATLTADAVYTFTVKEEAASTYLALVSCSVSGSAVKSGTKPEIRLEFDHNVTDTNYDNNMTQFTLAKGSINIQIDVSKKDAAVTGYANEKRVLYVTPKESLAVGTYTLTVGKNVRSNNGETLAQDLVFIFNADSSGSSGGNGGGTDEEKQSLNNPLSILSVTMDGEILSGYTLKVDSIPEIAIACDRGMTDNFETNKSQVVLYKGGTKIGLEVYMKTTAAEKDDAEKRNMYAKPLKGLEKGEYTLKILTGLKANNGNTLKNEKSYKFSVTETGEPAAPAAGAGTTDASGAAITAAAPLEPKDIGKDVPENYWAKEAINALIERGVIKGDANTGNVRPADAITVQEIASLMTAALGLSVPVNSALDPNDNSSAWAAGYLSALQKEGILTGDENGYFNGKENGTRLQVIAIMARAMGISGSNLSVFENFEDGGQIPSWAKLYVAGMIEKGLLKGYEDGSLRLDSEITRAEVFALLERCLVLSDAEAAEGQKEAA